MQIDEAVSQLTNHVRFMILRQQDGYWLAEQIAGSYIPATAKALIVFLETKIIDPTLLLAATGLQSSQIAPRQLAKQMETKIGTVLIRLAATIGQLPACKVLKDSIGAPYLANLDSTLVNGYHFPKISITHTNGLVAIIMGTSPHIAVGIDAEISGNKPKLVAKRFMSEAELDKYGKDAQLATIIWAAKEAAYKYWGGRNLLSLQADISITLSDYQTFIATINSGGNSVQVAGCHWLEPNVQMAAICG